MSDVTNRIDVDAVQKSAPLAASAPRKLASGKPLILVDYEKYAHLLEDDNLTEGEKREFLQSLWSIIVEFVSLGFGVHPLQQLNNDSDNNEKSFSLIEPDMLPSAHPTTAIEEDDRSRPDRARVRVREES